MLKNIIDYRDTVKFWAESLIWSLLTVVAFLLRLDGDISGFQTEILYSTAILLFVKMAAVYWFGTFRQSGRNTGFRDLISLLKAVVIVTAIFFVGAMIVNRSEEHTSELQSRGHLVCRLLLEKKNIMLLI